MISTVADLPASDARGARALLGVERSVCGRRWVDRLERTGHQAALAMAQHHDLPELLARVVAGRGVLAEDAPGYLDPSLRDLMPDPSRLAGMDAAADRLARAVRSGEPIAIFGDYDVDGATSAALLARFLRFHGVDPSIHIPDRILEGYGPNNEAITALARAGARLLVTVDCGSTSHEALEHAARLGLDTLVVDHHQIGADLPTAVSVVNPNRQDDLSGQGHLAAVGVVFLLLVATNRLLRAEGRPQPDLLGWLDLVALGTVADVVPLTGLNRAYVRKGLIALRRRECIGLAALADAARLTEPPDTYHLGFLLGPRINAGGRIGDAGLGVKLLLCGDSHEAASLAATLDHLNGERQAIEARILEEALAMVEAEAAARPRSLVIAHSSDDWHPGVVGIVAARLKEKYALPAFAIAFGADGLGTGSGRSIRGVDLGAAVRAAVVEGLAVKGGGHAMAAGLTVQRDRLSDLGEFLDAQLSASVAAAVENDLKIDGLLTAAAARPDLVSALEAAGPFGSGNPQPVVALAAHRLAYVEPTAQGHVRLALVADGSRIKAIAFRAAGTPLGEALLSGRDRAVHVAGTLRIDRWGGREEVQLAVRDMALHGA